MQQYLLSSLIITPLVAALVALFIPSRLIKYFPVVSIIASVIQIFFLIQLLSGYQAAGTLEFVERQPWITLHLGSWGVLKAEYFLAVDGLNISWILPL